MRGSQDDLEQSHEELLRWADFGRWLEAVRLERGMTRTQLAGEAHMGVQTLVTLENGGYRQTADGPWITPNPKDETLISLARILGVHAQEMFRRVGRYDDRPRTQASLRRATGRQIGRERIEELERRVAELEETVRRFTDDTQEQPIRRRPGHSLTLHAVRVGSAPGPSASGWP